MAGQWLGDEAISLQEEAVTSASDEDWVEYNLDCGWWWPWDWEAVWQQQIPDAQSQKILRDF